jgi:hypothetical protein
LRYEVGLNCFHNFDGNIQRDRDDVLEGNKAGPNKR